MVLALVPHVTILHSPGQEMVFSMGTGSSYISKYTRNTLRQGKIYILTLNS